MIIDPTALQEHL